MSDVIIAFDYMNHKGVTRRRKVRVTSLDFLRTINFGYQPGWYITGVDIEKDQIRSFALSHIKFKDGDTSTMLERFTL